MEVQYHGWSAISVDYDGRTVGFDLQAVSDLAAVDGDEEVLCVTHGHPDHCGALREAADASERIERTVVSSPEVVEHFAARDVVTEDRAIEVTGADVRTVNRVEISTFRWTHLPLLPPGLVDKARYLAHILSRPLSAFRIATTGVRLPLFGPTLGFHLDPPEGPSVLNYAEGLHRQTDPSEVDRVARRFEPVDVLLCAIEPEDAEAVPRWLERLDPGRVLLYEAHRPWRERFGLGGVDLPSYARRLEERLDETRVEALVEPGTAVPI